MSRDGMCPRGLHGLDWKGQPCDLCAKDIIIRLLWTAVADRSCCTCAGYGPTKDECSLCEAMKFLGYSGWTTWREAETKLDKHPTPTRSKR